MRTTAVRNFCCRGGYALKFNPFHYFIFIMFYGSIQETRQLFFLSWQKYKTQQPLLPLEEQIVAVIKVHPEYHELLTTNHLNKEYFPELGATNPFLHMGLHLALRDQISTDRPAGITKIYRDLVKKYGDTLAVEHLLMERLAECLWAAQRARTLPDEIEYLHSCSSLLS